MRYWLAEKDPADVINHIEYFHGKSVIWSSNPIAQAWARNTFAYHSPVLEASSWETSLGYEGEQGELVRMMVPQARHLVRQLITLVTKQRVSFRSIAEKRGSDVMQEVKLSNAILEQEADDQNLDARGEDLVESALVEGMGFLKTTWRSDRGEIWTSEGKKPIYSGKPEVASVSVFDCLWSYDQNSWEDQDWVEVRTKKLRWDLIEQFPKLRDRLLALPSAAEGVEEYQSEYEVLTKDDYVWVYELYHRPCATMPKGRLLVYADADTVFYDDVNMYGCIPVRCMMPEPIRRWTLGYPMFSNLMPMQEMLDHSFSAVATNQSAFAVQNVTVPRGSNLGVQDILGMNFISYTPQNVPNGGKPEPLNLTQSSPETFKFIDLLHQHMQQLSNISPAARGEPPPGVTSGTAIATLTANAIEFINSVAKSYNRTMETVGYDIINAYRHFAKVEHIAHVTGRHMNSYSKEFVGKDLDPIKFVKISRINPVMQTLSGRTDLAEKLVQSGLIKNAQDYFSILEGEDISKLTEVEMSENDLIESENERIMDEEPVQALSTDDHPVHVRKHAALLNNPEVRMNSDKIMAIMEHIEEHLQLSKQTDPYLTAMVRTGQAPASPPAGGQGAPGGEVLGGADPSGAPPPDGEQGLVGDSPLPADPAESPAQPAEDLLARGV